MKKPKRECVKWVDSRAIFTWTEKDDIDMKISHVTTIGHVVKETKTVLCMAASFDKISEAFDGIMLIPKIAITSRKTISGTS